MLPNRQTGGKASRSSIALRSHSTDAHTFWFLVSLLAAAQVGIGVGL